MDKITFVSAYYRIRDKEQNIHRNDQDQYFCTTKTYMEAFQLLIDHPIQLVVFTDDPQLESYVQTHSKYPSLHKIIHRPFESLVLWPYLDHINLNDQVYHVPNNAIEKFTPLYYLIIHQKLLWVREAIHLNLFPHSTHIAWIDIRARKLSPVSDEFFMGIHNYLHPSKINITMMASTRLEEVNNRSEYYKLTRGKIAATFFMGPKMEMLQFGNVFIEELGRTYMALTEEAVLGIVCRTHQHLFHFHYGDYQDTLSNLDGKLHTERSLLLAINAFGGASLERNVELVSSIGKQIVCQSKLHPRDKLNYLFYFMDELEDWNLCIECAQEIPKEELGYFIEPIKERSDTFDFLLWNTPTNNPQREQFKQLIKQLIESYQ